MSDIPVKKGPSDKFCPFWKEKMSKVCHKCPMWCRYESKDRDGKFQVGWECGIAALSPQMAGLQAGVYGVQRASESFRNEMVQISNQPIEVTKLLKDK